MNRFSCKSLLASVTLLLVMANSVTLKAAYFEGFDSVASITANNDPLKWAWFNKSQNAGAAALDPSIGGWWQADASQSFNAQAGPASSFVRAGYDSAPLGVGNTYSNWYITPTFDFVNGDTFSFYTRTFANSPYPDRLQIRLSTSGTSNDVGNSFNTVGVFTNLLGDINSSEAVGGYPEAWTQFTYSVNSSFTGRIALRYYLPNSVNTANLIGVDSFSTTANLYTPVPEPSTTILACVSAGLLIWQRKKLYHKPSVA